MPSFLCCSSSSQSLPLLPEEAPSRTRFAADKVTKGSVIDGRNEASAKLKLQTLLDETLLPGQLPGISGAAGLGRSIDADTRAGVPLLEDTLCSSTNSRSHVSVLGAQGEAPRVGPGPALSTCLYPPGRSVSRLHIPAHLQKGSASFSADYRDGEQVMSPASFSEGPPCRPPCSGDGGGRGRDSDPRGGPRPFQPSAAHRCGESASLEGLWLLLDPPLLRSVSRRSGLRRLFRHIPLAAPEPPKPPAVTFASAAAPAVAGAAGAVPAAGASSPLTRASCGSMALALLQQELRTAEALPCCPLLLLPRRVYEQPDVVHVVYDSAGDFTDLHSYLRTQQRLPEASCRSVMRQLLQALSVLHERRWVHRNLSAETVWVADAQPDAVTDVSRSGPPAAAEPGSRFGSGPHALERSLDPLQQLDPVESLSEAAELTSRPAEPPHSAAAPSAAAASRVTPAAAAAGGRTSVTMPVVRPAAASQPRGAAGSRDPSGRISKEDSRRSGGWLPSGGDDDPPAAPAPAPLERPSSCGSSTSSSSTSTSCSGAAPPAPVQSRQRPEARHCKGAYQQHQLHVKLGGLALAMRPAVDPGAGQEGALRELTGCAYQLAPEAISGAGYGRPADVWAAGVLLYMLLTGRPPFPGANELEVMTRVLLASSESSGSGSSSGSGIRASGPPARPPSPPPPPAAAAPAHPPAQLPGQPYPTEASSPPHEHRRSSGGGAAAGAEALGSRRVSDSGPCGVGSRQQEAPAARDPLRELAVQAVLEARASAACREVLAGMLVAEPERRLTAAELLRLPWFLGGPEEEG